MREIQRTLAALPPTSLTSTQIAQTAFAALGAVATMTLTSVQLRVLNHASPRHWRYVIGWVVCVIVIGGLLTATDMLVGESGSLRRLANFTIAALLSALGLAAGSALARPSEWTAAPRLALVTTMLVTHALIVFVAMRIVL